MLWTPLAPWTWFATGDQEYGHPNAISVIFPQPCSRDWEVFLALLAASGDMVANNRPPQSRC